MLIGVAVTTFLLLLAAYAGFLWLRRGDSDESALVETILAGDSLAGAYRPMERLLRGADWEYLSNLGYSASQIRKVQSQRRAIARGYLRSMNGDFTATCRLVRALMVQSPTDRSDLAAQLSRLERAYSLALCGLHLRLTAQALGIGWVKIDVSVLTGILDWTGAQIRTLQEPQLSAL